MATHPATSSLGLSGIIGAVAATLLYQTIPADEGMKYKAYQDIIGVWTICAGDTLNVVPGEVDTQAKCMSRLDSQLSAKAKAVMKLTPGLKAAGLDYPRAGAVSLGYNVGIGNYAKSSVRRWFNAGKPLAACSSILLYDKAGGRVVHGLQLRRRREFQICITGLSPAARPDNLVARLKAVH